MSTNFRGASSSELINIFVFNC